MHMSTNPKQSNPYLQPPNPAQSPTIQQLLRIAAELHKASLSPDPGTPPLGTQLDLYERLNAVIGKVNTGLVSDINMLVSREMRAGYAGDAENQPPDLYEIIQKSTLKLLTTTSQSLKSQHAPFTGLLDLLTNEKYSYIYQRCTIWCEADKDEQKRRQLLSELEWIDYRPIVQDIRNNLYYEMLNYCMEELGGLGEQGQGEQGEQGGQGEGLGFGGLVEIVGFVGRVCQYLNRTKMMDLIRKILRAVQRLFSNPETSKQLIKQNPKLLTAYKLYLQNLNKTLQSDTALSRSQLLSHKKTCQSHLNTLGLSLLSSQSVQKRLTGLRLLHCNVTSQLEYYQWVRENGVLELVLRETEKEAFVNNSSFLFRIVLRNMRQGDLVLDRICGFLGEAGLEGRKGVLRFIEKFPISENYNFHDQIVEYLLQPKKPELMTEQVFDIVSKFISKISSAINQDIIFKLVNIYLELSLNSPSPQPQPQSKPKPRPNPLLEKSLSCIVECLLKLAQKRVFNEQETSQKLNIIFNVYKLLLNEPIRHEQIVLLGKITERMLDKYNILKSTKDAIVEFLVVGEGVLERGLSWIRDLQGQGQARVKGSVDGKTGKTTVQEIESFLCCLLGKVGDNPNIKSKVSSYFTAVKQSTVSFVLFQKILSFEKDQQHLKAQFQTFLDNCSSSPHPQTFSPISTPSPTKKCIRHYFQHLNRQKITQHEHNNTFQTKTIASELEGVMALTVALMKADGYAIREELAQLLADINTSYGEACRDEGQAYLEEKMKEFVQEFLEEVHIPVELKDDRKVLGLLALMKHMMLATETQGVGRLRAHNSLVTTHFVNIKVTNDQKKFMSSSERFYERRLPANMTVMDMLDQACEKFQCNIFEVSFMQGNHFIAEKYYGLTLEEAQLDGKPLRITSPVRSTSQKHKEKLANDGKLTQRAKKALTEIYNKYADSEGKMGASECADFVAGVTSSASSPTEERVVNFMSQYDDDLDGNITLHNFMLFYENSLEDRQDEIWKNLNHAGYRYDLKKNFQRHEAVEDRLLFRYHLNNSPELFKALFALSKSSNPQIKQRAIEMLFRLPTHHLSYAEIQNSIEESEKYIFQIEYYLIAVQDHLLRGTGKEGEGQMEGEGVREARAGEIYEIMNKIYREDQKIEDQKCLLICIKILRSLCQIPDLRYDLIDSDVSSILAYKANQKIPSTDIFISILQKTKQFSESEELESIFALQLSQVLEKQPSHSNEMVANGPIGTSENGLQQALSRVFNPDIQTRFISCNYIYMLSLLNHPLNPIFTLQPDQKHCNIWFETLTKILQKSPNPELLPFPQILESCLTQLTTHKQTLQNPEDPIIYGNLSLLHALVLRKKDCITFAKLVGIAENVLSTLGRKLVYSIMIEVDFWGTVFYLKQLVEGVKVEEREISPKMKYVGLDNLGSTCYINSVIQLLFWIEEFRNQLLSLKLQNPSLQNSPQSIVEQPQPILTQIQKIFSYLLHGPTKFYQTAPFCSVYKNSQNKPIDIGQQQDAHEFSHHFLQVMQKFFMRAHKKEIFQSLLTGLVVSELVCSECEHRLRWEEKFLCLGLEVRGFGDVMESFDKFTAPEDIEDYKCQSCNKKPKMTKHTSLSRLPKYLIINLNRILYDIEMNKYIKISSKLKFPQTINLQPYITPTSTTSTSTSTLASNNSKTDNYQYRLKAAIVHSGTCEYGHYYPYVRIGDTWVKFDDKNVAEFDFAQVEGEIYGGTEDGGAYDDARHSRSAYILCFEHISPQPNPSLSQLPNPLPHPALTQKILTENTQLLQQQKLHNPTIFLFCLQAFNKLKPQNIEQLARGAAYCQDWAEKGQANRGYSMVFDLSVALLRFLRVFWRVGDGVVAGLGSQICYLLYLLPQKSEEFLLSTTAEQAIYYLCSHPQPAVKQIYKHILAKTLHILHLYSPQPHPQTNPHIHSLLTQLHSQLSSPLFAQNIYQMDVLLEFWKICIECIRDVEEFVVRGDMLGVLLGMLACDGGGGGSGGELGDGVEVISRYQYEASSGKDNIMVNVSANQPKVQTKESTKIKYLPPSIAKIICYLVQLLYHSKTKPQKIDLAGKLKLKSKLSQKQLQLLLRPQLYSNVLKNGYDGDRCLASVIAGLAENSQGFSLEIAEILLKSFKVYEDKPTTLTVSLEYTNQFLCIADPLAPKRLKWLFGIAQLQKTAQNFYGFKESIASNLYNYISTLYFSEFDKYKPILHQLWLCTENESHREPLLYYFYFVVCLCGKNQEILGYLWKLPSPVCSYSNYFNWLEICFRKMELTQDQYFPEKKQTFTQKCKQAYQNLKLTITTTFYTYLDQLPNYYIIGRNKNVECRYERAFAHYQMTIYEHETYVLKNRPNEEGNLAVGEEFYDAGLDKYFVGYGAGGEFGEFEDVFAREGQPPESEKTVYTLEISSESPLKLNFKLESFREQIYIQSGKTSINFPYEPLEWSDLNIEDIIEVTVLGMEEVVWSHRKYSYVPEVKDQDKDRDRDRGKLGPVDIIEDNREQFQCNRCTVFNNIDSLQCTVCGELFN